ncbi:MAG: hybrid sensor histidine kinase/response regulator [Magnetococcales bacterium]|nr:hybrid sensor histidine kinase/response regulator [Magnetococcales bacterium]
MDAATGRYKILVVDDEPTNLRLLREILRNEYALVFARNGVEMLRYVADGGVDLILLDVMMPEMDGYTACARLKEDEQTRDIPVIFVTARIETADEVRGLDLGAVDYLTKPVQGAVVRARIKTHLQLLRARQIIEQQNEELRQAARLRDDVDQILRHDLKAPLNAIIGLPGVLIENWHLAGERAESIKVIEEAGFRMLEMINRSLDLYKMERGSYPFHPEPVDLLLTLKRILPEIQRLILRKKLTLAVTLQDRPAADGENFMVTGEALLCHSLLANLLKNAVEAAPQQGALTVRLEEGEQLATIRITNPGEVPMEIRATFFDKYVTSGKRQGTGLGTYSARLIATTMGGSIELDTSQSGETTLLVRLPRSS